jgi:acyl-CoA reductase-like NAD-dependent aldehyde dehydrogenase
VLGLEAKNPAIVLPDADLELTVRECLTGALSFNGQRCSAIKIIFVHTNIIRAFLDKFSEAIAAATFGLPWEKEVSLTPLPEPGKPEILTALVKDALDQGPGWSIPAAARCTTPFLSRGGLPGGRKHAPLPRRAVRPGGAGGALL